jgi:hypothetical protein
MMTPEKSTMAAQSGGKRDRLSDGTDQPNVTPNTRDTKTLCNDAKDPIGKGKDDKLVEIEHKLDSVKINEGNDGVVKPAQEDVTNEVIDVDAAPADLHGLIASGGLEDSPGSDTEKQVPKTLFKSSTDKDEMDECDSTKSTSAAANKPKATDTSNSYTTPTKNHNKNHDKKNTTPPSTEKNNNTNNKNKEKQGKEQKKNQEETKKPIKKSNEDKKDSNDKIVLTLDSGYKPPTLIWRNLDTSKKEIYGLAFKMHDYDNKMLLEKAKVLKYFNLPDDAKLSRDDWVRKFIILAKLPDSKDFKFIKRFGVALAATDPVEIFTPQQFKNGTTLFEGPMENAWAGAYTLYGAGWLPEIGLDISSGISPPSDWWKGLIPAETMALAPFLTSEIFADRKGSMHDQEKLFKNKFGIKHHIKIVPIRDWISGFKNNLDDPETRAILIKLALTPINVFDSCYFADQLAKTKLNSISITNFWIAAYRIAGAPWNLKTPPPTNQVSPKSSLKPKSDQAKNKPKPTTAMATPSPKQEQNVSFDSAAKKPPGLFISRPAHVPTNKVKPKAEKRKYQDKFYSVKTPAMNEEWKSGSSEITSYFNNIVEHIMAKDKKAIIHCWDEKEGDVISKKSASLTNRPQVKKYVNSLYLRQGAAVEFRIRVSHDVHSSKLEIDNPGEGLHLSKDHIQERNFTTIGYLVGSSPAAANLDDIQEAHENHPGLAGLRILAKVQPIKLAAGKNLIPWELQVKAVHIIVGESQANIAREKYSKVYGSRNEGGYPQGIHARFVPDISDMRFPVTASTRTKAIKMLSKQKAFLDNTRQINTSTIAGLHIFHPTIKFTLCQVLMSMRSIANPDFGLFISIDDKLTDHDYQVTFTVHLDRFNEAASLVPLLCILLQAKFGMSIDSLGWFTDDAKRVVTKYKWSPEEECVVLIHPEEETDDLGFDSDDEYMTAICNIYNIDQESDGNGFEFDMNFVVEDDIRPRNQYGDSGSVKTFHHAFDPDGGAAAEASELAASAMDTTPAVDDESKPPANPSNLDELIRSDMTLEAMILNNIDPNLIKALLQHLATTKDGSPKKGVAEH